MTNGYWSGRRTFVTGATGFVGSWLVNDLLKSGAQVSVLVQEDDPRSEFYRSGDIDRVTVIKGDLEDYPKLERALGSHDTEVVFHLGAQAIVGEAHLNPLVTFETNIRGTYNLLEACRVHSGAVQRIVIASSDKAYGDQPVLPYTEDMSLQGKYPYEVSKSCADLITQTYYHSYGLPVAISRCGNIYGGGDVNWSRIVPGTIRSFLCGDTPVIRSDGKFVRDYIFVKDVVQGYMCMAEQLGDERVKGQAFNFSTESPVTVLGLFEGIQRLMEREDVKPDILDQAEGEIHSQHLSAAKAREVLGWQPRFDLDAGLKETIDWYRDYLS